MHLDQYKIIYQREVCLIPGRKYRWDFWIPAKDLAIECQGQTWQKGAHSSGYGLVRDYRKSNAAAAIGVKCMFFSTAMIESGEAIDAIRALFH